MSVAGVLVPGAGLIAAGRRGLGLVIAAVFLLGVAVVAVYGLRAEDDDWIRLGADPERMNVIGFGLIGVALAWLLVAIASFFLLEPPGLSGVRRSAAFLVVVVAASAVIAPMGIGSHYAFTQRGFIESVFPDEREQHSLTIPHDMATPDDSSEDTWAGRDRVNLLILGSDAGKGRVGIRTDTIMVASVDTRTGATALFSLPRNLQYTPLPEGPLRDAYPNGFHGFPASEYWLYAIYQNVPAQFPEYFEGIEDKGAEAMKLAVGEALGLDVHYYIMVNLDGFEAIVDALGGVVIDVPYDIPVGTQTTDWGCTEPRDWIEAGSHQHLTGAEALWFARARCGPAPINNDYERMRRQRCMIGAIAEQANPFTLLTRYLQVESAVRDNISTDIGRQRLEDFADLALEVQDAEIRSLPFTDEIVEYTNPDFELIQQFVQDSLDQAAGTASSPTPSPDGRDRVPAGNGEETDGPAGAGEGDADAATVKPDPDRTGRAEDPNASTDAPESASQETSAQSIDAVC